MAVLDDSDFTQIKQIVNADSAMKAELKAWGLSRAEWHAALQAAEDWFVSGFSLTPSSSFKAAIEVETGSCTNAQANQLGRAWFRWRDKQ